MGDTKVLSDEDIKTTWQRGQASTGPSLGADPDTTDPDSTDTDGTDGDSGSDADGTDSDSDSKDS